MRLAASFTPCSHHDVPCCPRPNRNKQQPWAKVNTASMYANYSDSLPGWQEAKAKVRQQKGRRREKEWSTHRKRIIKQTVDSKWAIVPEDSARGRIWGPPIDAALTQPYCVNKRNFRVNKAGIYLRKGDRERRVDWEGTIRPSAAVKSHTENQE